LEAEADMNILDQDVDDVVNWAYHFSPEEVPGAVASVLLVLADEKETLIRRMRAASAIQAFPPNQRGQKPEEWGWTPGLIVTTIDKILSTMVHAVEQSLRERCYGAAHAILFHGGIKR